MEYDFRAHAGADAYMPDRKDSDGLPDRCPVCDADLYDLADGATVEVRETVLYLGCLVGNGEAGGDVVTGFREMGSSYPRKAIRLAGCVRCGARLGEPGPVA